MNRLDVLRQVNITQASRFIIGLAKMFPDNPEALEEHLKGKFTKEELQRINDAAREEGLSPLVFIP